MKQTIDISLFKKNPQLFFSQLPEKAEDEITEFLRFVIFKYRINVEYNDKDIKINKFNLFKENPIKVEKITKYTREKLHER